MRHHASPHSDAPANQGTRNDWGTLKTLLPYLWAYKWRVIFALLCLVFAKVANVAVPLVLKELIDGLTITPDKPASLLILPAGLLIIYGLLRLSTTVFTELREFFFAKVTQRAVRTVALIANLFCRDIHAPQELFVEPGFDRSHGKPLSILTLVDIVEIGTRIRCIGAAVQRHETAREKAEVHREQVVPEAGEGHLLGADRTPGSLVRLADDDPLAGLGQKRRGGEPVDTGPDDDDVAGDRHGSSIHLVSLTTDIFPIYGLSGKQLSIKGVSMSRTFDAVIVDAYRQPYIPFHLSTVEFFEEVRDRLTPNGVVAINVGTPPDEDEVVERIAATMRSVFPAVLNARYGEFNSVLLGFRDPAAATDARTRLATATGDTAIAARILAPLLTPVAPGGEVFTDDHAPVEKMTDGAILDYLNKGAPGA